MQSFTLEALRYWESMKRDVGLLPSRHDLRPSIIKKILPNVILIDVLKDPLDFRYRLIGTCIDAHSSDYYTGRCFSDIDHQNNKSVIWKNLKDVSERKCPVISHPPYVGPHKDFLYVEDVIMPLADNGRDVDMLFVVVSYLRKYETTKDIFQMEA